VEFVIDDVVVVFSCGLYAFNPSSVSYTTSSYYTSTSQMASIYDSNKKTNTVYGVMQAAAIATTISKEDNTYHK
jgi:hypothetical protein